MSQLPRILVLDDDKVWLDQIPLILEDSCEVDCFSQIDDGLNAIRSQYYEIVLLDMNFENDQRTGLEVFKEIQAVDRGADVIMITGESNLEKIFEIANCGVTQFIPKPATPAKIRQAIEVVLNQREAKYRSLNLFHTRDQFNIDHVIIGKSKAIRNLKEIILKFVSSNATRILLQGETGTGKEVVAKAIAQLSDPCKRFIPINCAAITETLLESELFGHVKGSFTGAERDRIGAFEAVGGGYVFLDEIGDMPLSQQSALLRVIESNEIRKVGSNDIKKINFRLICASHVNLKQQIATSKFREDLFFRIAQNVIVIPPLRERTEDIDDLVYYFLALLPEGQKISVTSGAMSLLKAYSWPGNVRQLKSAIESLAIQSESKIIREKDVCQLIPDVAALFSSNLTKSLIGNYGASIIITERRRFEKALLASSGDREEAAKMLGISRSTFFRKAKYFGIIQRNRIRKNKLNDQLSL